MTNLIPLADHKRAVAQAYQRAADVADDFHKRALEWAKTVRGLEKHIDETDSSRIRDAILDLADTNALAEVQALQTKATEYDDAFAHGVAHKEPERVPREWWGMRSSHEETYRAWQIHTTKESAEKEAARWRMDSEYFPDAHVIHIREVIDPS